MMKITAINIRKAYRSESLLQIFTVILILYFYCLGLQKFLALNSFRFWLLRIPGAKNFADILYILIPVLQLLSAAMLLHKKTRMAALIYITATQLIYIGWIIYIFFLTPYLVWPWRPLWPKANWFQILLLTLAIAWLALASLKLNTKPSNTEKRLF